MLPTSVVLYVLAPELIRVALGPAWGGVVPPFRILAIGMLFRTSYKMSDAIARATGNVYRRALRQVLYAGLVIGGAIIGQRWGVNGVALAVFVALAVNFAVMAELGLRVTRMTLGQFAIAHVPPLLLAAIAFVATAPMASLLRALSLPGFVVAVISGGVALGACALAIRLLPLTFLGPDGVWMLSLINTQLSRLSRPRRTVDTQSATAVS